MRDYDKLTPKERRERAEGKGIRRLTYPITVDLCPRFIHRSVPDLTRKGPEAPPDTREDEKESCQEAKFCADDEWCLVRNEPSRLRPVGLPPCKCSPCCQWRRKTAADNRFSGPSDSWEQPDVGAIYRKWGII